jgi:glycosyltransferase involved in cell wall biosynthesis
VADPRAVSIIIPACNEAGGIGNVVRELIASAPWREILVVDDGSTDGTAGEAQAAGATVLKHPYRKGNGAAVKTGLRAAVGEYVLILDGDGQHPPADAVRLAAKLGDYDLVVGARTSETQAGVSRRAGNWLLNWLASYLTERPIPDLTSGFRAARRTGLLEFIHLLPNGFSTPTTTTLAFLKVGYSVAFEPIQARAREGTSKIRFSRDGVKFLLIVLRVITIYSPFKIFLPISALFLALGTGYAVYTIWTETHIAPTSVLMITLAVMVFLVGLVSEQISALRFEGRK